MKTTRFLVAAAVAVVLGAPCASAQSPATVTPRGTYALVPDSGYAGPDISSLMVMFADDNSMTITAPDGSLIVRSKLAFESGVVTLNDQDGSNVCQYAGKYRIVGEVSSFKLSLVEDGCSDRSAIIVALKFVRQD